MSNGKETPDSGRGGYLPRPVRLRDGKQTKARCEREPDFNNNEMQKCVLTQSE